VVCVVVVVTGAGTVVCSDVVVVVLWGVDEQAHSEISAAATAQGMMSLFMVLILFRWLIYQSKVTASFLGLYGVLPPPSRSVQEWPRKLDRPQG
jgi:hypothetical protein